MKLTVIALLTGTLALVGCGDDAVATGGSGGSGATGGAGGGAGGAGGGTGGAGGACETTCGVGNTLDPAWASDTQILNCSFMNIGLGFESNLTGQVMGGGAPVAGVNTYDLQPEAIVSAMTANIVSVLAESSEILGITATVVPTAGTTDTNTVDLVLDNVPCTQCWEMDTAVSIVSPAAQGTWDLNDGTTQTLTLQDVVIEIDAGLGTPLVLSTMVIPPAMEPACSWDSVPPSLSFTAIAAN